MWNLLTHVLIVCAIAVVIALTIAALTGIAGGIRDGWKGNDK